MGEHRLSPHDRLVEAAVQWLRSLKQMNVDVIAAALPDYPRPESIRGYIPDATATLSSTPRDGRVRRLLVIVEAEVGEALQDPHTKDQWTAFCQATRENGGRFVVVVSSQADKQAAWELLRSIPARHDRVSVRMLKI